MTCQFCGYVMPAAEKACPRCGVALEHNAGNRQSGNAQSQFAASSSQNPVGFAGKSANSPGQTGPGQSGPAGPYSPPAPQHHSIKTGPGHGTASQSPVPPYNPSAGAVVPPLQQPVQQPVPGKNNTMVAWGVAGVLGIALIATLLGRSQQAPPAVMPVPVAQAPAPQAPVPAPQAPAPPVVGAPAPIIVSAPAPASVKAPAPVKIGPSFSEVDAKMDDRLTTWTQAQRQSYWASVSGSQVTWSGEVVEVEITSGGEIRLKCNPQTFASDVDVKLDGSQINRLSTINKGQRITIQGILQEHSMFGYQIAQGRVVGL